MATVIKSNSVASRYIASGLQLSAPIDFKSKLDFSSEKYILNGVETVLAQVVTTIRASVGGYLDNDGAYMTAAANTPRIHNDPVAGKGLLCESAATNVLANPSAPATQTVSISPTVGNYVVLQVWGSGSASLNLGGVEKGVANQSAPLVIVPTASGATNAIVTVTGTLTHFQLFISNSAQVRQTKILTTSSDDVHTFRPSLPNPKRGTLLLKRSEIEWKNPSTTVGARVFNIVQLLNTTSGLFSLGTQKGIASPKKAYYTRITNDNTGVVPISFGTALAKEVIAICYDIDAKTLKILENGIINNFTLPNYTDTAGFERYILGTTAAQYWSNYNQIIQELYVYDRILTDTELLQII